MTDVGGCWMSIRRQLADSRLYKLLFFNLAIICLFRPVNFHSGFTNLGQSISSRSGFRIRASCGTLVGSIGIDSVFPIAVGSWADRQQTVIMVLMSIESYRTGKIWICKRLYGVVINRADGNRQKGSEMENGDQHVWIRIVQQLDRGSRKGGDRGVSRMADKTYISIIRKTVSKYNWYYLWILYLITSGSESRSLLFYSVRKIWQRALAVSPTGLPMILQPTFGRSWIFHAAFCHCSTSWVFHPEFWRSGVLICSYFCWW